MKKRTNTARLTLLLALLLGCCLTGSADTERRKGNWVTPQEYVDFEAISKEYQGGEGNAILFDEAENLIRKKNKLRIVGMKLRPAYACDVFAWAGHNIYYEIFSLTNTGPNEIAGIIGEKVNGHTYCLPATPSQDIYLYWDEPTSFSIEYRGTYSYYSEGVTTLRRKVDVAYSGSGGGRIDIEGVLTDKGSRFPWLKILVNAVKGSFDYHEKRENIVVRDDRCDEHGTFSRDKDFYDSHQNELVTSLLCYYYDKKKLFADFQIGGALNGKRTAHYISNGECTFEAMFSIEEIMLAGEDEEVPTTILTEEERQEQVTLLRLLQEWLNGGNDLFGEHTPENETLVRSLIATVAAALLGNAVASGFGGAAGGAGGSGGSGSSGPSPKEPESEWDRLQNRYMRRRDDGYDVTDPATGRKVHFTDNGDGTYAGPNDWGTLSEEQIVNEIGFRERNAGISAQDQRKAEQNLREQRQQEQQRQQLERETGHIMSVSAEEYREWKSEHDAKLKEELHRLDLISKYGTDKKGLIKSKMMQEQMAAEKDYRDAMARADFNDKVVKVLGVTEKAADIGVGVLAQLTGPEGKAIKDAYTMLKAMGKSFGEAASTRQATATDIFKALSYGAAQGGLGVLSNNAGKFKDSLGGWGSMATSLGTSMAQAGLSAYKDGKPIMEAMGRSGLKSMYGMGLGKMTSPLGNLFSDEYKDIGKIAVSTATGQFHSNFSGPAIDKAINNWRQGYNDLIDRAVQISNQAAIK